jgi:hypothetical protein
MASLRQSTQAYNKDIVMTPSGANDVVQCFADFPVVTLVINDIIEMVPLPADCVLIDLIVDIPDMDTSTGFVFDAGLMSGDWGQRSNSRTCGAEFISASTGGQAAAIVRPNVTGYTKVAPAAVDRSIGLKVTTAASGTAATTGTIRVTALFRPQRDTV